MNTLTIVRPKCGATVSELKDSSLTEPKVTKQRWPCEECNRKRVERFVKKHGLEPPKGVPDPPQPSPLPGRQERTHHPLLMRAPRKFLLQAVRNGQTFTLLSHSDLGVVLRLTEFLNECRRWRIVREGRIAVEDGGPGSTPEVVKLSPLLKEERKLINEAKAARTKAKEARQGEAEKRGRGKAPLPYPRPHWQRPPEAGEVH